MEYNDAIILLFKYAQSSPREFHGHLPRRDDSRAYRSQQLAFPSIQWRIQGGALGARATPLNDRIHSFVSAMARIVYTRRSRPRRP